MRPPGFPLDARMKSIVRQLAERGCAQAQFEHGKALVPGPYGTKHPAHGWTWLEKAARALPHAQLHAAQLLREETPHALPAALERRARAWELAAARAGLAKAKSAVAWWGLAGTRDRKGLRHARRWFQRALAAGDNHAGWQLATEIETCAGDLAKVEGWLAQCVVLEEDTATLWTLHLLRRAKPWLRGLKAHAPDEWRRRAEAGDAVAQTYLGYAFRFSRGVPYDPQEAQRWWERAARSGYAEPCIALGASAWDSELDVDLEHAMAWFARALPSGDPDAYAGAAAYDWASARPDVRRAFRRGLVAARAGHLRAAFGTARCYTSGSGVRANARQAARWMRVAAEGGIPEAQTWYAEMLAEGDGVRRSAREAVAWLRRAAEQGNPDACVKLGVRLHEGKGTTRDDREAVRWYRRAARLGDANALYNLGLCAKNGHGVRRDPASASRWLRRAALLGEHATAPQQLSWACARGRQDQRGAVARIGWLQHAAVLEGVRGLGEALKDLGVDYHNGAGVAKDHAFSALLYRAAADRGNGWAAYCLGLCHRDGEGAPKSLALARRWWRLAAERGVKQARDALKKHASRARKASS